MKNFAISQIFGYVSEKSTKYARNCRETLLKSYVIYQMVSLLSDLKVISLIVNPFI